MSTVTRERLAEIKARYTAASDKPWSYDPEDGWIESDGEHGGGIAMMHPHGNIHTVIKYNEKFSKADAEFITHARTDVPDLVETLEWQAAMTKALSESQERLVQEVKEARAEAARLKEHLRHIAYEHCDSPVHYAMNQLEEGSDEHQ